MKRSAGGSGIGRVRSQRACTGRLRSQRGASAVEFALVAPLLFMLVFGIIDFGLALNSTVTTANAAREGARLGAVDLDPVRVEDTVRKATQNLDQARLTVTIACTTPGGSACAGGLKGGKTGDKVTVSTAYRYDPLTPIAGIIGKNITINSVSAMRIE